MQSYIWHSLIFEFLKGIRVSNQPKYCKVFLFHTLNYAMQIIKTEHILLISIFIRFFLSPVNWNIPKIILTLLCMSDDSDRVTGLTTSHPLSHWQPSSVVLTTQPSVPSWTPSPVRGSTGRWEKCEVTRFCRRHLLLDK